MSTDVHTKSQILDEIAHLRAHIAELEASLKDSPVSDDDLTTRPAIYPWLSSLISDGARAAPLVLRMLVELTPAGLVICNPEGTILLSNSMADALLGGKPSGSIFHQQRPFTLHRVDGSPFPLEDLPLARAVRHGEATHDLEILVRHNDGRETIILASGSPVRDSAGHLVGALVVFQDITAFRRAEQQREQLLAEIETQRQLFQTIIQHAPVGILVLDGHDLRVRWANPALQSYMDEPFRSQGIAGLSLQEFLPRAEEAGVVSFGRQVVATGQPITSEEFRFVGFQRGVTYWKWSMLPLPRADDSAPDVLVLIVEITDQVQARKRTEELASETKHRADELEAVIRSMAEPVIIYDLQGWPVKANPAAVARFGINLTSVCRNTMIQLLSVRHPDGRPFMVEELPSSAALQGKVAENVPMILTDAQGRDLSILSSAAPITEAGQVTGVVVAWHDVTELRQAEAALRQARDELELRVQDRTADLSRANQSLQVEIEERRRAEQALRRLASIVESSDDAISSIDTNGVITSWNRGAERLFGFTAEEAVGRSVDILIPPDRREESAGIIHRVQQGQGLERRETVRLHKDGRPIEVSLTVSPIRDANGTIVGSSAITRDISPSRRLEREVVEISEAERRRIGLDLHDSVGQDLTGIAFLTRSLQQQLQAKSLPEAAAAASIDELVTQAIRQARALARGLMPVAKEDEGLMNSLGELAGNVRATLHINCQFEYDAPVAIQDASIATQLYRIAQEAVSNAIKHGRPQHIWIRLRAVEDRATLVIEDDGAGRPELFSCIQGMGLRIMDYRARMIGAALAIRSRHPSGTIVECTFRPHFTDRQSS